MITSTISHHDHLPSTDQTGKPGLRSSARSVKRALLVASVFLLVGFSVAEAGDPPASSLFPQGQFKAGATGVPEGWTVPDWCRRFVSTKGAEGETAFLRLHNNHENWKEKDVTMWVDLPLPETVKGTLVISWMYRLSGLEKGTLGFHTAGIEGKFSKGGKSLGTIRLAMKENAEDWTAGQATGKIPDGAEALTVRLGFWHSKGTLEVKDLQVRNQVEPVR